MRKQLILPVSILLFLVLGTLAVVAYGRGYRFGMEDGKIALSGTGLLVASSTPDGAQVFINDKLSTATDDTINLFPGEYTVKIVKEGYFSWEKKIKVQKEIVAKAEATLFPSAPKLESITSSGVQAPIADPSMTRLAYTVASQSARKNGIYVIDMSSRPILTLQSASNQVINDISDFFSTASLSWSPDGQELIATLSASQKTYLLSANDFNDNPQDVTNTLSSVEELWQKEQAETDKARTANLKPALRTLIQENFKILSWSLDETKILYQASKSATLSYVIKPRLIGIDATPEQRTVEKDKLYVYDIKEDKNYALNNVTLSETKDLGAKNRESSPAVQNDTTLRWMPDSRHLLYVHDKKIDILEFDGTNQTTIFAGPFIGNYVFPWPNGSKMVILTNLGNENILPNLYTIDLE